MIEQKEPHSTTRTFKEEWKYKYFFDISDGLPFCLICHSIIKVIKVSNIRRHFELKHPNYKMDLVGEQRAKHRNALLNGLSKQERMIETISTDTEEASMKASFLISCNIAKSFKPFTEGTFAKKCIRDVCKFICPDLISKFENIRLSPPIVARRTENIDDNLSFQLKTKIKNSTYYAIALDESCDINDTAQLLIFIRLVSADFVISEELLSMIPITDTTTGEYILMHVLECFEEFKVDITKLVFVITDGAGNMLGKNIGFCVKLEEQIQLKDLLKNY